MAFEHFIKDAPPRKFDQACPACRAPLGMTCHDLCPQMVAEMESLKDKPIFCDVYEGWVKRCRILQDGREPARSEVELLKYELWQARNDLRIAQREADYFAQRVMELRHTLHDAVTFGTPTGEVGSEARRRWEAAEIEAKVEVEGVEQT